VGDAVDFFELSERAVHHLVCYCHQGHTMSTGAVAARLRPMARRAEAPALPARTVIVGGLSVAAALGLVVLAL
jgi:hypothetical protein